jgi:hypothetical protein
MEGRIASLHHELTKLGAAPADRPARRSTGVVRPLSFGSEFDSANIPWLRAELDGLELRSKSVSPLPAELSRSLAKLREQVEWLEHLLQRGAPLDGA